jgi:hypothetical protein
MRVEWKKATTAALGLTVFLAAVWTGCGGNDPVAPTVKPTGSGGATASTTTGAGGSGGSDAELCPGATLCGEACTNTQFDPMNCGACG